MFFLLKASRHEGDTGGMSVCVWGGGVFLRVWVCVCVCVRFVVWGLRGFMKDFILE